MITEDYVSFEIAKLLKEKGFAVSEIDAYFPFVYNANGKMDFYDDDNPLFVCEAVTLQMAMKWLREVKRCIIVIIPKWFTLYGCAKYAYSIWADDNLEIDGETNKDTEYDTYKEATEAAIKYCLENLI